MADFVVDNGGDLPNLEAQVDSLWDWIGSSSTDADGASRSSHAEVGSSRRCDGTRRRENVCSV